MEFSFLSTGDPERDRREAEAFLIHDRRIAEGMCPNGHGPMVRIDEDGYEAECPVCFFHASGNSPRFKGLEKAPADPKREASSDPRGQKSRPTMPIGLSLDEQIDFIIDIVAQGNPGATIVARKIMDEVPIAYATLFGALLFHGCVGPELWCAYKDRHGCDIKALIATIEKDVKP